eukprot:CAMPEP_0201957678 /NCGR_PEP_ID=MMETSP0904-20121228/4997_1 /ASSEMBLY_ACC=CAM_ASM_000553 /TAXON_ID=420261 /ORGANISM="Thalassiosira antarctica, Strain CCMP982" /LENGTH=41 /DNA_ID= /DNA_START= /DNA_END= /DNA_ORIENTATION=
MGRRTQLGDAPLTVHFSTRDESGLGSSWSGSPTNPQDQISK